LSIPQYFGAWSAYFGADLSAYPSPAFFYELSPPLGGKPLYKPLEALFSGAPRSLEIWWDGREARIVYACEAPAALQPLRQAYPGLAARLLPRPPEWPYGECVFFDVELSHALPWVWVAPGQEGLLVDRVVAALSGGYPATWVQLAFMKWDWTWLAEEAAIRWQSCVENAKKGRMALDDAAAAEAFMKAVMGRQVVPFPRFKVEAASSAATVYQLGERIAQMYREKAHSTPLILHVRGAVAISPSSIPGNAKVLEDLLAAAFSVDFELDSPMVILYRDRRALEWMERRALPDPTPFLEMHALGGFLCEWGEGREMVPVFCITPQELPVFIHLPTDPALPVHYVRAPGIPIRVQPAEEEGLELWSMT